jgi:hypothetical protein
MAQPGCEGAEELKVPTVHQGWHEVLSVAISLGIHFSGQSSI